jgi:hypothetical protein
VTAIGAPHGDFCGIVSANSIADRAKGYDTAVLIPDGLVGVEELDEAEFTQTSGRAGDSFTPLRFALVGIATEEVAHDDLEGRQIFVRVGEDEPERRNLVAEFKTSELHCTISLRRITDRRSAACGDLPSSSLNTWEGLDSITPH